MVKTKRLAIKLLQAYSRIGHLMSDTCELIKSNSTSVDEIKNAIAPVGKLMADIQFEIIYPIIESYPELRPEYLLDKDNANVKYSIFCWDEKDEAELIIQDIDAVCVREEFNRLLKNDADLELFFWMEMT